MENFGKLDRDIYFDVLSTLPTKDLVGLKCVSKGWQTLISDPSFIRMQFQKKQILSGFFYQQRHQYFNDDQDIINYIPAEMEGIKLHQNVFDFLPENVVILTSCNGLVCCRSSFPFEEPAIYICNPLNKEWIKVDWSKPNQLNNIALAFDPSKDLVDGATNFKLVEVLQDETEQGELYYSFSIYFSKRRDWKLSNEICWCNNNLQKNKGVFIGGVLHWLTDGDQILTFKPENEFTWLISTPIPSAEFKTLPEACIGESAGRLQYVLISEVGIHVWFLENYFDFNWVLKYSTTLAAMEQEHPEYLHNAYGIVTQRALDSQAWMDPLAYKDEILLLRVSTRIYLYHFETRKMTIVGEIPEFGSSSTFCPTALPYCMSLVPLKGA